MTGNQFSFFLMLISSSLWPCLLK